MRSLLRRAVHVSFFSRHRPQTGLRMILFYHSVGSASPLSESPATFRTQLQYVAKWFHAVRLSEFLAAAAAAPERNLAAVTFDDGFEDNATIARDLLEAEGLPGTFFVITARLGGEFQTSAGPFRLMTPAQVRSLADSGHEIGSHSATHPKLPDISPSALQREVGGSKRYLEDLLGTAVSSFAYPKGRVNEQVRRCVEEAGYRQAVVTRRAFVEPPVDPLTLPRLAAGDYIRLAPRRA
ncbi:MAG TPA: polysaccharide deacetylase family protein [bacterium]